MHMFNNVLPVYQPGMGNYSSQFLPPNWLQTLFLILVL